MIDMHSHTTASDGELSPEDQIALAAQSGVTVLSVTDHDTVAALEVSHRAAEAWGVRVVSGIEISAFLNAREIHILGHFINPTEPELQGFEKRLKADRLRRMEEMVSKLKALNFSVTMDMVLNTAGDASLTRPHLARVMARLGYCRSPQDAFERFLGASKPAYVPRLHVPPAEAIGLISGAGGTATIAHPGINHISRLELASLARDGLSGVEVNHSNHPFRQQQQLKQWAEEFHLVQTAGSDYHGPTVAPGRSFGKVSMDPAAFEALAKRACKA